MKKVLMLVMSLMVMVFSVGFAPKADAAGVLKVATDANFPPFEYYVSRSNVHTGFDIDLMDAVAKEMGYDKVEFVNVDFKNILPGLALKNYDAAIAGLAITPERAKRVEFSEPYAKGGLKVAIPVQAVGASGLDALRGRKVAGEAGSYGLDIAAKAGAAQVIAAASNEEAIQLVIDRKADCIIAEGLVLSFFITNGYGEQLKFADDATLNSVELGIAVAKGNTALVNKINEALHEVKRSGKYKEIYRLYFGA